MKRVLITGKNSYIGMEVEKALIRKAEFMVDTLDMRGEEWKAYDFSAYDTVFHVAGIAHADLGKVTEEKKKLYYKINAQLAEEAAEKAKKAGVKQFIFMSSMIIYGESGGLGKRKIIGRETVPSPSNFYGDSKWEGDKRVRALADKNFHVAVIRAPMIYGRGCKGNYRTLEKLALLLPIFPDIYNERSVLHIKHLCEVVEKLIAEGHGGIYFPQDENYGTTSRMVEKIARENGKKIWVTGAFNFLVYIAAVLPNRKIKGLVKKAFGNMVYEKQMSNMQEDSLAIIHQKEKKDMLVSVIIATYRREKSLRDAVISVMQQSYSNIEIIIVDDNADAFWNRKVEDALRDFKDDKRLVYIRNRINSGSAESRNIGIRASKGVYITFLDDDDLYKKDKIRRQLLTMTGKGADFSITDITLYDENGRFIEKRTRQYIKNNNISSLLQYHFMYHITGPDTFMFKKEYLLNIGMFPPCDIGDDFYLMENAIRKGGKLCYIPTSDVTAVVHMRTDGLSNGESKIQGENRLYEYKRRFFNEFDKKTVRYIKMRHYAVLAYAEYRRKHYYAFVYNAAKSVVYAPVHAVRLALPAMERGES